MSATDGLLELFYPPKFWVHFPRVIVGEPIVITYHLYTLFSHMYVFCRFFHTARLFSQEVDSHLVAHDTETGLHYPGFRIVYSTAQFDCFITRPTFLLDIEDFEESLDEEE